MNLSLFSIETIFKYQQKNIKRKSVEKIISYENNPIIKLIRNRNKMYMLKYNFQHHVLKNNNA